MIVHLDKNEVSHVKFLGAPLLVIFLEAFSK